MLELTNVEMMYNNVILVLKGISMAVSKGTIVTLLGANGAGKTTTLKCISGMEHVEEGDVTEGQILFEGKRIDHMDPTEIVRLGIVQVLEGRKVLEHLTVERNLLVGSHLQPDTKEVKKDIELVYSYFPPLKGLWNNTSGYLSGGEQQMLVLGRALMARPKLILLDEPSLGLSPLLVQEIFRVLKRLNEEQNLTMLIVEQNARVALAISQYGYILENGRLVLEGSGEELIENEDIKEFYLGLSLKGKRKSYREVKHYKRRKRWLG
ncbi:MAG: ABC transporter ATP-binding protein [Desulfatiglans sp.]|jgi:branched-chain amino acid transport system ATP-binding protein|nr:ABC transporter ATP-binding protein [Thermodesulfobacteriota bacterium]MEE4353099.1 ABC transporter ATP-binding protein [Desulfatiglans sp.]